MAKKAPVTQADRIRQLNDHARRTFTGAAIIVTAAFEALCAEQKSQALQRVRTFEDFDDANDPHREHDMAFFEQGEERFFFKFDYYDPSMQFGSDDPADETRTRRVLTIGLAADY
jgi:hypothetical protein